MGIKFVKANLAISIVKLIFLLNLYEFVFFFYSNVIVDYVL